jgi:predicted RNA-binding Zn ribbon-like protein
MEKPSVQTQRLVGGALCLDFANSVDWSPDGEERPAHTEVLAAPADLVAWGRRLGVVDPAAEPPVTDRELQDARRLRRALHDLFAHGARDDAVAELVRIHAEAVAAAALAPAADWRFEWPADDPRRIRFAVAVDAVDLLRRGDARRVRVCPGTNCGWLFVDRSGRRRWCSMDTCGSRAKMRRLYERRRARS